MGTVVTELYLVKLNESGFSVPADTIGYVSPHNDLLYVSEDNKGIYQVHWIEAPGPGGMSAPIHESALTIIGRFWIPLEVVESLTPAAKLERALVRLESQLHSLHAELNRTLEEYHNERRKNVS